MSNINLGCWFASETTEVYIQPWHRRREEICIISPVSLLTISWCTKNRRKLSAEVVKNKCLFFFSRALDYYVEKVTKVDNFRRKKVISFVCCNILGINGRQVGILFAFQLKYTFLILRYRICICNGKNSWFYWLSPVCSFCAFDVRSPVFVLYCGIVLTKCLQSMGFRDGRSNCWGVWSYCWIKF